MNSHQPRQSLINVTFLYALLLLASLFWYNNQQQNSVQLAVAKGKQLYDMSFMAGRPLNGEILTEIAMADSEFAKMLAGKDFGFVNALKLSHGEANQWIDEGCQEQDCAHLIFYDYTDGGTVNAIMDLDTSKIIGRWAEPSSRPNGSSYILPKAIVITSYSIHYTKLYDKGKFLRSHPSLGLK